MDKEKRQKIVMELYLLGISVPELAKYFNFCFKTIREDIKQSGGQGLYLNRSRCAKEVYKSCIVHYLYLIDSTSEIDMKIKTEVLKFLGNYLHMKEIMFFLEGIETLLERQMRPRCKPEFKGHLRLLLDIFSDKVFNVNSGGCFGKYIEEVGNGKRNPPSSVKEFKHDLLLAYDMEYGDKLVPFLSESGVKIIEAHLSELEDSYQSVLRKFYFEHIPMANIAKIEGVKRQTIYKRRDKALARLRDKVHADHLLPLLTRTISQNMNVQVKQENKQDENSQFNLLVNKLLIKFSALNLSIKLSERLQKLNFVFVGDIMQKTEEELRNLDFGKKNLRELKEVFKFEIILELGSKLDSEVLKEFFVRKGELS